MSAPGETSGLVIAASFLVAFAVACALAMTGTLDDVVVWVVGEETLAAVGRAATLAAALVVVGALCWVGNRAGKHRVHIAPHHAPGADANEVAIAVQHEAMGHAAVGAAVRGTSRGIRARVYPDGSGWCEVPRAGVSLAGSLAITVAGEDAAGPSGCSSDRARYARDLRRAPRRYRAQVEAEATRLRATADLAFGRRVARSLARTGRFR